MTEDKAQTAMHKALFTNLIMMLSSSTMQQLGKLVNPMTNKTEINLEGAQITIDMLTMIQAKTKGNLDKDEEKLMSDIIPSLQMNYVEVSKSAPKKSEAEPGGNEEAAKSEAETGGTGDTAKEESAPAEDTKNEKKPDGKDPKFHKSYDK
ncbi:DUF1844 domain-containing protein [Verrucomicrobiota bacterium]